MPQITDAAIHATAAAFVRGYAASLDYLDLAEHLADDDTVGSVRLADLDGPEIDDLLRRILDAAHAATITVGWPATSAGAAGRLATFCRQWVANPTAHVLGAAIAELVPHIETVLAEREQPPGADPAEFGIVALHACDIQSTWIQVHHVPCAEVVFGGTDDAEDTNAGELLERMAAHRCDAAAEPRDVSQFIDVEVDGGTVIAAVHGSRALDVEEQEAMAEILRAARRKDREERQRKARERDEDVRAVAEVIRATNRHARGDSLTQLHLAISALEQRFDDRIAELAERGSAPADGSDRP